MTYAYLNNIELDEALKQYMEIVRTSCIKPDTEEVPVGASSGRITSRAVIARISSPHYNACAMDGIALFAARTFGATDTTPVTLSEGEDFIRVDTGDPLPGGCDAVVMIEDVIDEGAGKVKLLSAAAPWQHVRQIGEDICAGEMILPSNTRIEPAAVGAMLAGGVLKVEVWKKPLVGLIPTGDEIVGPTGNPGHGEIIEFNSSIFSAMLAGWNAEAVVYPIVPDRFGMIVEALKKASEECDLVIVNAGSSAGREDLSLEAVRQAGRVFVHGIAIRPGKPAILGMVNGRPVIGVPGYPVSGIIVMERIVKPVIEYMAAGRFEERTAVKATLSRKLVSSLKYREFIRVRLGDVDGKLVATPLNRGAGVVTSFVKADGILDVPLDDEGYESGHEVSVQLLRSLDEIRHTLVVTGSHDPLIDVVSDLMRRTRPEKYVSSAHVGSMGGIMAVRRSETHAAGIHLLDEDTGEYNISYVKKYLAGEKIALLRCARRQQGFMTAPGNPLQIKSLADICRKGIRYVNRQKGSGTRILLDYLLRREGIPASGIYGYEREELTHMSVAALVASDSADMGMGILSAAKTYGLDFIPVCEEQYDFILREKHLELEIIRDFIDILKSAAFRDVLESMGGYALEDTGKIIVV